MPTCLPASKLAPVNMKMSMLSQDILLIFHSLFILQNSRGNRFGKTPVPLTKIDKDSMKLPTERCLSVLYFTSNENVKRYQYTGENVIAFVAQPGDQHAAVALSAFINGMCELNTVAIVRYCRAKNAAPKLGFLSPHIKQDYECLLFTALGFLEDLRQFAFAPLNENKKWEPSGEQKDAVDNLITAMDLTAAHRDEDGKAIEALKCKTTFNPHRQRVFQCIQHRALNPDDQSLPDLEPVIASYLEPSAEFKARCAPECTKVKDMFHLEKIEKKRKKKKTAAAENVKATGDEPNGQPSISRTDVHDETDFSMASLAKREVTQVSTVDPVGASCTMISQTDEDRLDEVPVKEGIPPNEVLEGLAKKVITEWKRLGRRLLESDEAALDAIHKENEEFSEKAYKMLLRWKQANASGATYRVLHDALCHELVDRKDLAERFCFADRE